MMCGEGGRVQGEIKRERERERERELMIERGRDKDRCGETDRQR